MGRPFIVRMVGLHELRAMFRGLPPKMRNSVAKKGVTEVKKSMVIQARAILAPHKRTGQLAKSLGHRQKGPRYPIIHKRTGDAVTMMRAREGFAITQGTWGPRSRKAGNPKWIKPRAYDHLADKGTTHSKPINYNRKVLSRHRSKATKILTVKVRQFIHTAKAKAARRRWAGP